MAKDNLNIPGLCEAVRQSRLARRFIRGQRREAVRQYVGKHWSEEGSPDKVPVNLIALFVNIFGRALVSQNPRVMLSTFIKQFKPTVAAMEQAINDRIEHIRLADTLQRIVIDALFNVGIAKVALATPSDAAVHMWNLRAGEAFVEQVDEDDFACDTHARRWEELAWVGHKYRVPLDTIQKDSSYSSYRKRLIPTDDYPLDAIGEEKVSMMGRTYVGGIKQEWGEYCDLWEIYLPRQRMVITLPDNQGIPDQVILRKQKWIGPDQGPYHFLGMMTVPGNLNPKAPIQDLLDLHEAVNGCFRKLIRTVERIKEVTFVRGGAMEDGSRAMKADDGDIIRIDSPDDIKQVVMGGTAIQQIMATAVALKDLYSYLAGNLDIAGGLSPQSKTAHQDAMLNENSSRVMNDMQQQVTKFVASVINSFCWYEHHHPLKTQTSEYAVRGMPQYSLTRNVTPEQRAKIPFEALRIRIDPYSMRYQSPEQRLQALTQLLMQILTPMGPQLAQQGIFPDMNFFLQKWGKYTDNPDVQELVTIKQPPDMGSSGGESPAMPQSTTRNYVRENVPGQTREASDRNMVTSMLGIDTGGNPNKPKPMGGM